MTPTHYMGHELPPMSPEQRRWRQRLILGEVVAYTMTTHELDGLAHLRWKLGRRDANGQFFGGARDGQPS